MVLDNLSNSLKDAMKKLAGKTVIDRAAVDELVRDLQRALLSSDVNVKLVMQLSQSIKSRALAEDMPKGMNAREHVLRIVYQELVALVGKEADFALRPQKILMAGLQGSGKTTHCAKIAKRLKDEGHRPLLVAGDVYRPAAIKQLQVVGEKAGVPVFERGQGDPVEISKEAISYAKDQGYDFVFIDTAGRLHVDETLMEELQNIKAAVHPTDILLVVDAMTGQDAVNVASSFNDQVGIDGIILTKLDGDTRGGAALSAKAITGKPILYVGTGEKLGDLDVFHPDRMASRILGMGDMLSFIERAEQQFSDEEAAKLEKKMRKNKFDLNDLLANLQKVKSLGNLQDVLAMIPGVNKQVKDMEIDEKQFDRVQAIIYSMTPEEREKPEIINPSRKRRIAAGCGQKVEDVNRLLSQYRQMRKMFKQMNSKKARKQMRKYAENPEALNNLDFSNIN